MVQLKLEEYAFLFAPKPDNELIGFDCETTSLNLQTAEIYWCRQNSAILIVLFLSQI